MPERALAGKPGNEKENKEEINPLKVVLKDTIEFDLLNKIADSLEVEEVNEDTGDQTDGFVDKVKEIIKEIFEEFKDRLDPTKEKRKFERALIKIFSILLNTKINSAEKI